MSVSPLKLTCGILWGGIFSLAFILLWQSQYALADFPVLLEQWLDQVGLIQASLLYLGLFAVRHLLLFPPTLLTIAAGLVFGPWLGALLTIIGENASANIAFSMSRWFGRKTVEERETEMMSRWDERLSQNGIVSVMTMRMIMLPFDAVNFVCGLTSMRQRDYAIGTFLGILPALIGFVLLGGVAAADVNHRLWVASLSVLFMLLGFGLARKLQRKETESREQV